MDSLKGIQCLIKAVQTGSIAAAGRQLGISAAAASQNIARLEKQLGCRLLVRTTRQLALTDAGERFYRRCLRTLDEARLAIEVDGRAHDSALVIAKDAARSRFLREQGIATTRIAAKLVLEDIDGVVQRLVQICDERMERMTCPPLHQPAAGPPPLAGEDQA